MYSCVTHHDHLCFTKIKCSFYKVIINKKYYYYIWNGLPDSIVGEIWDNDAQFFKSRTHHLFSTVAESSLIYF